MKYLILNDWFTLNVNQNKLKRLNKLSKAKWDNLYAELHSENYIFNDKKGLCLSPSSSSTSMRPPFCSKSKFFLHPHLYNQGFSTSQQDSSDLHHQMKSARSRMMRSRGPHNFTWSILSNIFMLSWKEWCLKLLYLNIIILKYFL